MRKIFGIAIMILVASATFANGQKEIVEFNPEPTLIEGTWIAFGVNQDRSVWVVTYVLTGNKYEHYLSREFNAGKGNLVESGLFTFNKSKINLIPEKGRRRSENFVINTYTSIDIGRFYLINEKYYKLTFDLIFNEETRNSFPVNQIELDTIQGTWKAEYEKAIYIFAGNEFTVTSTLYKPISGIIKINDNYLALIVNDVLFGLFIYELLPNNRIFFHALNGRTESWWGEFIKQ